MNLFKTHFISLIAFLCIITSIKANAQELQELDIVDTTNHIYSFSEMECDIISLAQKYPDYITCTSAGISHDQRTIWQIVIGNPQAPKAIHIQAGIHGREWMNCWMLMKQTEEILKNWNATIINDISYGDVFEQCAVYIIPMVNPDGVTISQFGTRGIRSEILRADIKKMKGVSNTSRWKANAVGVDLNRNFSVGWGEMVNVNKPCSEFYNGIAAFTEPEVLALVNSFTSRKFNCAVSYHSMEGAIYWNIGQKGQLYDDTYELAKLVQQITGYKLGEKSKPHGLDYNWMILDQNVPTVVIETGTVQCPLPYSQWKKIWKENQGLIQMLAMNYAYSKISL